MADPEDRGNRLPTRGMNGKPPALSLRIKAKAMRWYATLFGKVPFRDRFGLRYYLWKNTRLRSTILQGVRTDDTGVIVQVFRILERLATTKSEIICFDVGAFMARPTKILRTF